MYKVKKDFLSINQGEVIDIQLSEDYLWVTFEILNKEFLLRKLDEGIYCGKSQDTFAEIKRIEPFQIFKIRVPERYVVIGKGFEIISPQDWCLLFLNKIINDLLAIGIIEKTEVL